VPRGRQAEGLRVRREERALADGFSSPLIPGVVSSTDASRLADEIAFAAGRLKLLAGDPPGFYREMRELAATDREQAAWGCFLAAYMSPLEGEDPFWAIQAAFQQAPAGDGLPDLQGLALGPRSSHDPARGSSTLLAYRQWAAREGFLGDASWGPERRFERIFERLSLPGFQRAGRYDLLVTLGRLGIYELRATTLALAGGRARGADDLTEAGAKRVFAIGDPLLLERRAQALAQALAVPLEALDLGLANWAEGERATLGVPAAALDEAALAQAAGALGI
jgi:hypothetical protein